MNEQYGHDAAALASVAHGRTAWHVGSAGSFLQVTEVTEATGPADRIPEAGPRG